MGIVVQQMTIRIRDFHWYDDTGSVMEFLAEVCQMTQSLRSWIPSRFENRKFGPCGPEYRDEEDSFVKIWEEVDDTGNAKIVAISIITDSPDSFFSIHPDYHYLTREIIQDLEKRRVAKPLTDDRGNRIAFFVETTDTEQVELLKDLGYNDLGLVEHNRIRPLDLPTPDYELPEGYSIRHVTLPEDFEKYRAVQGSVFSHCGTYMTEKLVVKFSQASFWHEGLDLVAVAPDGSFAAFTTVRLDPSSGITEFEPVGTHPDHRNLGLARAVIIEGLKRLQNYSPSMICIPGAATNDGATRLYDSLGFTRIDVHAWRRFL